MKWKKLGLVFAPDGNYDWMMTHAANPIAMPLSNGLIRTYFSCRDCTNRSSVGFVDINLEKPSEVLAVSGKPVLSPGERGFFDDSGVTSACLISANEQIFLYYVGWNLCKMVPWRNSIGLALYDKNTARFEKNSLAPVMDRCAIDPLSLSYPYVIFESGIFRMWYGSNLSWGVEEQDMEHVVKYAQSEDGIHWQREGVVCIDFKSPDEYAIARPSVVKDGDTYKMWYSYRGKAYRIGYAESVDGIKWTRKDEDAGIDVSSSGWDSEMIEYPYVFDHKGKRYMLYNGNGYGKTGFGLAVLGG